MKLSDFTSHLCGVTSVSTLENKAREPVPSTDLNYEYQFMDSGTSNLCLENDAVDGVSLDFMVF